MEILLAACLLAYAAGARSEQAKLGISPAQRAQMRDQARHEKAVRKLAAKNGTPPPAPTPAAGKTAAGKTGAKAGTKGAPAGQPVPGSLPAAFVEGYREHTPVARVATVAGRRTGNWAAQGVHWVKDTGRSALVEYRKRRKAAGHPDPAPVLVPMPPARPPDVPPMPQQPPAAARKGVSLTKPGRDTEGTAPHGPENAPDEASRAPAGVDSATGAPNPSQPLRGAAEGLVVPEQRAGETAPADGPETTPDGAGPDGENPTTDAGDPGEKGVGRMASDVTYGSVLEESDELSLLCEDDMAVYRRIYDRCEREIGRADELMAQLEAAGAGSTVTGWVARCKDQYQAILAQLDELARNTLAQGEAVTKAKTLLQQGQGVYAEIAEDMESVAERDFYTSDVVDGEDTAAHGEVYETTGA